MNFFLIWLLWDTHELIRRQGMTLAQRAAEDASERFWGRILIGIVLTVLLIASAFCWASWHPIMLG
jgi:hypothetical protein